MKVGKSLKLVLGASIALSLFGTAGAAALVSRDGAQVLQAQTTSENLRTTLQQRLTERKEALTDRLTATQTARLEARCEAAQTKLVAVAARTQTAVSQRQSAYTAIQTRLSSLLESLPSQTDGTALEAAIAELGVRITAFEAAATTYQQTLADLAEIECTEDAEGFKASLEAARDERAALVAASKAARTHIQETLKPILQTIRTSLVGDTE